MMNRAKSLSGYALHGLDGQIGKVKEFYFDDRYWTIRYLVADTGDWLADRLVLISPHSVSTVNNDDRYIDIELSKQQIADSPSWNTDKPVSRQFEESFYGYYGWPVYWDGPYMWGAYPYVIHDFDKATEVNSGGKAWDPDLRSTRAVSGYHMQARDGEIGHVKDFLIDNVTWAIRYLIVDTQNWWPGKKVLISPKWIERVSWGESKVWVNLLRESIRQSPEYTEESALSRDYEKGLHRHYDREGYWVVESETKMLMR